MDIKKDLEKIIIKALKELDIKAERVHLEHPVDLKMGDYSSNTAMIYAKNLGKNPKELAEKIINKINSADVERLEIDKVEVAGPGFINFHLNKNFFEKSIKQVLKQKENYGNNKSLKGQKIMIEFTDPNPFKEFHVGHLMSNSVGEAVSRVIEAQGAKVIRANYQGDVGMHVAKAIWGLMQKKVDPKDINIFVLAEAYSDGAKNGDDEEIKSINKKIYEKSDEKVNELYIKGRKTSLDYFEIIYKKLGTNFKEYFFESNTGIIGGGLVKENIGEVFEKSDGAIVFKGEKHDSSLHTRVFMNSEGIPTYEAKELGLVQMKFKKYPKLDLSISITGNEITEYFKVLLKVMELINPKWSEKTKHIGHGMLRLPEGKMSSRTGDVVTAESLIEKVEEIISQKSNSNPINSNTNRQERKRDIDKKTVEQISIGAIKYSILKSASGKDIIFDFEKSLAVEGNSGPYLQYTYARAKSVLEKGREVGIKSKAKKTNEKISDLEKLIYRFPEIVERAGKEYEPHYIATYLFELAKAFNSFYGNEKIADKKNTNASYNIALTESVTHVIKNGLNLLGIESPERL